MERREPFVTEVTSRCGADGILRGCFSARTPVFIQGDAGGTTGIFLAGLGAGVAGLYDDVHVLIEGDEEAQKGLHAPRKSRFRFPQRPQPFLKAGL
jgi:hypothetical protein